MSRTLWRVRPRGERPTTVAKPKENLIADCPLLNHYLGGRWPSTTCRCISVLSLPQTDAFETSVAGARSSHHPASVKTPVLQRATASTAYRIMPACHPSSY